MNNHKVEIRKTKYRTNRGMSMLEVIIAVSIFSVAAAVLLQGFVTSGRVNKKSGLYLEATTIAQNVTEEIKAKSFEEVALAFNYPIDDETGETRLQFLNSHKQEVGGALGVYEVLPARNDSGNVEYKKVTLYNEKFGNDTSKVTASVISEDQGKTYEFNPRETGTNASKYYFILTNVENDNEIFDVLVELDGSASSGYKSSVNTINADKKNDYMAPNILKMDKKTNALFILDEKKINEILGEMKTSFNETAKTKWENAEPDRSSYTDNINYDNAHQDWEKQKPVEIDEAELRSQMRMTLDLEVVKDGSGITSVENDVKFDASGYKKAGGSKYNIMKEICPCGGEDDKKGRDGCFCVQGLQGTFYNSGTDGELKDLFVFYSPNYASTSGSQPLDRISLDNTANQEIQFYIVKQKSEKNPATSSQEISYKVALEVKDAPAYYKKSQPNWYTNTSMFRSITKLRTNLNTNIATAARTNVNQLSNLVYVGADLDNPALTKKMQNKLAETILDMNGLDAREATDRIYKMNVGVYKKGAAEKGFPESELVASLEGAKEK